MKNVASFARVFFHLNDAFPFRSAFHCCDSLWDRNSPNMCYSLVKNSRWWKIAAGMCSSARERTDAPYHFWSFWFPWTGSSHRCSRVVVALFYCISFIKVSTMFERIRLPYHSRGAHFHSKWWSGSTRFCFCCEQLTLECMHVQVSSEMQLMQLV